MHAWNIVCMMWLQQWTCFAAFLYGLLHHGDCQKAATLRYTSNSCTPGGYTPDNVNCCWLMGGNLNVDLVTTHLPHINKTHDGLPCIRKVTGLLSEVSVTYLVSHAKECHNVSLSHAPEPETVTQIKLPDTSMYQYLSLIIVSMSQEPVTYS